MVTIAKPIAGETLGGTSAGPDSVVLYVTIAADAGTEKTHNAALVTRDSIPFFMAVVPHHLF
jgi:hypothetical protein